MTSLGPLRDRIVGRISQEDIYDPLTGDKLAHAERRAHRRALIGEAVVIAAESMGCRLMKAAVGTAPGLAGARYAELW